MANLRLFEAPVQMNARLKNLFPVLDELLERYCKVVSYWKIYTVKHSDVILVKNNVETVVLIANKKQSISAEEIALVKEKLFDDGPITEQPLDPEYLQQLSIDFDQPYKEIHLFKQVIL